MNFESVDEKEIERKRMCKEKTRKTMIEK